MNKRQEFFDKDVRLLSTEMLQAYMSVGRNTALNFAKKAGAEIRIGRRVLYDRTKIDKAIEELR